MPPLRELVASRLCVSPPSMAMLIKIVFWSAVSVGRASTVIGGDGRQLCLSDQCDLPLVVTGTAASSAFRDRRKELTPSNPVGRRSRYRGNETGSSSDGQ
jgi:hypothetical protein